MVEYTVTQLEDGQWEVVAACAESNWAYSSKSPTKESVLFWLSIAMMNHSQQLYKESRRLNRLADEMHNEAKSIDWKGNNNEA
jgi:hypothetical protein